MSSDLGSPRRASRTTPLDARRALSAQVVDTPDRILIMTTNHPEALDPALVRPGRVDIQLRLGFVELPEARQMVEHYVMRRAMDAAEAAAFAGAWEARPKRDVTPADLEQVCAGCDALVGILERRVAEVESVEWPDDAPDGSATADVLEYERGVRDARRKRRLGCTEYLWISLEAYLGRLEFVLYALDGGGFSGDDAEHFAWVVLTF